jgi:type IV secretory pathway VirB4 component
MAEISQPSQQFVPLREIRDGIVFLKNGSLRRILMVSGINFELKSEAEQGTILGGFQNFLNALDFSVQFFIHSRKVNVDGYLEKMGQLQKNEPNELLKIQIEEYANFIRNFVDQNAIISKTFFVIVPYDPPNVPEAAKGFLGLFKKSATPTQKTASENENLEQLGHRVEQVIGGLNQVGLRAIPMENEEATELFYNLYNPQLTEKKTLGAARQQK